MFELGGVGIKFAPGFRPLIWMVLSVSVCGRGLTQNPIFTTARDEHRYCSKQDHELQIEMYHLRHSMRVCERSKRQLRNSIFIENGAYVGSPVQRGSSPLDLAAGNIALSDSHRNCERKWQARWVDFRFNRSDSKIVTKLFGEVPRQRSPYDGDIDFLISHCPNNRVCTVSDRVEAHNRALQSSPRKRLSGRSVFFLQNLYSYFQTVQCGRIERRNRLVLPWRQTRRLTGSKGWWSGPGDSSWGCQ